MTEPNDVQTTRQKEPCATCELVGQPGLELTKDYDEPVEAPLKLVCGPCRRKRDEEKRRVSLAEAAGRHPYDGEGYDFIDP